MSEQIEKAIETPQHCINDNEYYYQCNKINFLINKLETILCCIQSEFVEFDNKPLTLAELTKMRHFPVWVKIKNNEPFCIIISKVDKYFVRGALPNTKQNSIKFMTDMDLPTFYKYKPKL